NLMPNAVGRNDYVICAQCGNVFRPLRRSARYCGDACRKRASRGAPIAHREPGGAVVSVTGHRHTQEAGKPIFVTLRRPRPLPRGIVQDAKYPSMYRLRLPGGSLSDIVNLTRVKDALSS